MSAIERGVPSTSSWVSAGLLLFAAAAGWSVVSALGAGGSGGTRVALILGVGAAVALSRMVTSSRPSLVPAGLVGSTAAIFFADGGASLRSGPLEGPFGYPNATAAFFAQACVAALLLVAASRGLLRVIGLIAAVASVGVVIATRSWTAVLVLPLVLLLALGVERIRGGRAAVAACGAMFVLALVATVALGALGPHDGSGPIDRAVRATITQERVALWNEALAITAEHPLLGVGPGRFSAESSIAVRDADLRWAHNEFLQAGAETGLLGYMLAVGIFLWGFVALWLRSPDRMAILAAAGLAVLGIHASVDYVLHFPLVVFAGAAILGTGLGVARAGARGVAAFAPGQPVRGGA